MGMHFFVVTSGEDGIRIEGPLARETVADRLRDGSGGEPGLTYYGRSPTVLDRVPRCDDGHFDLRAENAVLVIRGDIVSAEELTLCPCGSGKPFVQCHGAESEAA